MSGYCDHQGSTGDQHRAVAASTPHHGGPASLDPEGPART